MQYIFICTFLCRCFARLQRETSRNFLIRRFLGQVSYVFLFTFFLLSLIFTPVTASIYHFLTAAIQFSCCSFNKKRLLCFFSLALDDFLIELRWPVALLSLSRCSEFVDMTINLNFLKKYFRQHRYRNIFRLFS